MSKKKMQEAARRKVEKNLKANKGGKKNVFGNTTYSGRY